MRAAGLDRAAMPRAPFKKIEARHARKKMFAALLVALSTVYPSFLDPKDVFSVSKVELDTQIRTPDTHSNTQCDMCKYAQIRTALAAASPDHPPTTLRSCQGSSTTRVHKWQPGRASHTKCTVYFSCLQCTVL